MFLCDVLPHQRQQQRDRLLSGSPKPGSCTRPPIAQPKKKKKKKRKRKEKINGLALRLIFRRFSLFNSCVSVVLQSDKGDYPENSHVVFCFNKQLSSEPFMRLDSNICTVRLILLLHLPPVLPPHSPPPPSTFSRQTTDRKTGSELGFAFRSSEIYVWCCPAVRCVDTGMMWCNVTGCGSI